MKEPIKQFVRKVVHNRHSNHYLISVGRIIPRDWQYVLIRILEEEKNRILIELRKLEPVRKRR